MHSATLWLNFPNLVQKLLGITVAPEFTPVDTNQLLGFDYRNELVSKCDFKSESMLEKNPPLISFLIFKWLSLFYTNFVIGC